MLALLAFTVSASASDWYLETPARPDRAEVAGWEQREVEQGGDAHLVRRFVDGEGWRFVLRTEGLADEDGAMEAARGLADRLGVAVTVFEVDAGKAVRHGEVTPGGPVARTEPAAPTADAQEELARAVAAMGDTESLVSAIRDGKVLFAYRRSLADGRVVSHTWAASGSGLYLEIEPVEGAVVPSRAKVVGDAAWLSVDGGAWASQNAEKVRSTIESTGPTEVVPLVWLLNRAVETRREFERMRVVGTGTFDGAPTVILEYGGDAVSGALRIELGRDGLPCRVAFGEGTVEHEFRGWSRVRGAAVPGEIRTSRGGKHTDTVVVETLDPSASLPGDWFRAPN
jgi:hypothetical protein